MRRAHRRAHRAAWVAVAVGVLLTFALWLALADRGRATITDAGAPTTSHDPGAANP